MQVAAGIVVDLFFNKTSHVTTRYLTLPELLHCQFCDPVSFARSPDSLNTCPEDDPWRSLTVVLKLHFILKTKQKRHMWIHFVYFFIFIFPLQPKPLKTGARLQRGVRPPFCGSVYKSGSRDTSECNQRLDPRQATQQPDELNCIDGDRHETATTLPS